MPISPGERVLHHPETQAACKRVGYWATELEGIAMSEEHGHGNRARKPRKTDPHPPVIRKIDVDSVPYGPNISHNGRTLWGAFDDDGHLACVAATAGEARRKYRERVMHMSTGGGQNVERHF